MRLLFLFTCALFIIPCVHAQVKAPQATGKAISNKAPVLTYAEQMPQFNGDLVSYISKYSVSWYNIPDSCFEGRTVIEFIVEADGRLENIHVVRSPCRELGLAEIKMLQGMPRWIPGKQNGLPVRVLFRLPIQLCFSEGRN